MDNRCTFKCCKKEFSNLVCVYCLHVFHPSCGERRKGFKELEAHKVYCTEDCEKKHLRQVKIPDQLREKLDKYKKQMIQKDTEVTSIQCKYREETEALQEELTKALKKAKEHESYILKQRKMTEEFKDDVFEAERHFVTKAQDQINVIEDLNTDIKNLNNENKKLIEELAEKSKEMKKMEDRIEELNVISRQMVQTIAMLEGQYKICSRELNKVNNEVLEMGNKSINKNEVTNEEDDMNSEYDCTQRPSWCDQHTQVRGESAVLGGSLCRNGTGRGCVTKVLVLCDEYGKYLDKAIRRQFFNKQIQVETFVKPGGLYRNIIENIDGISKDFTSTDYIIVVAGANDLANNKYPSMRHINFKLKSCRHTNLILCSVPMSAHTNYKTLNFNQRLFEYTMVVDRFSEHKVSYLEINDLAGKKSSNHRVSLGIRSEIESPRKINSNLIFIKLVHEQSIKPTNSHRDTLEIGISGTETLLGARVTAVESLETESQIRVVEVSECTADNVQGIVSNPNDEQVSNENFTMGQNIQGLI